MTRYAAELVPALDSLADEIRRELSAAEADWHSAVGHAIRAGELLIEAKRQVAHGEWLLWLETNCPLSDREAQNYMRLARNPQRVADLPSIREAVALLSAGSVSDDRRERRQRPPAVDGNATGTYRVIYADPPWQYGSSGLDQYGPAERHYPTLSIDQLCDLAVDGRHVRDLADDSAVLFLWATSPLLPDALTVMSAWGFAYKASFVWDKVKHNYGHYNSVRHELMLLGTRGSCLPDSARLHDSVVTIERTTHSAKPAHFRALIDELYGTGDRVELFARETADGWARWGAA